ncbi:DUF1611 domain-containing protein [candidate division KSB1 bacterium]|nr:DUF1611 domain-containing protein [candidate division KSB1 bacterium]
MSMKALVYSENEFGKLDGKVANGLARQSEKYDILGIIDSSKAGLDAGEYLDGIKNGILVFRSMDEAIEKIGYVPEFFIYGIAPLSAYLDDGQREIMFFAMEKGMNIVSGLPEYFTDDEEFVQKAKEYDVQLIDVRKPPHRKDLHLFSGRIINVNTPVITVLGTDCAVGKRTTALKLVEALRQEGLKASFVTTGQTGLLQGSKFGIAVDVLTTGYSTGEVENAVVNAYEQEDPDIIVVEGQGSLGHPAFTSSVAILRGAMPNAIILQHPPKREYRCDFSNFPMPTLESEIELLEVFSKSKVIAITINHEDMTDIEVQNTIEEYEYKHEVPTTDVLKFGCEKLIKQLFNIFPELQESASLSCRLQD